MLPKVATYGRSCGIRSGWRSNERSDRERRKAQQGARANTTSCHGSCSEQHEPRQLAVWLTYDVRQIRSMLSPSIQILYIEAPIGLRSPLTICSDATSVIKKRGSLHGPRPRVSRSHQVNAISKSRFGFAAFWVSWKKVFPLSAHLLPTLSHKFAPHR